MLALQKHCGFQTLKLYNNAKCTPATLAAMANAAIIFFSHSVIVIALTGGYSGQWQYHTNAQWLHPTWTKPCLNGNRSIQIYIKDATAKKTAAKQPKDPEIPFHERGGRFCAHPCSYV